MTGKRSLPTNSAPYAEARAKSQVTHLVSSTGSAHAYVWHAHRPSNERARRGIGFTRRPDTLYEPLDHVQPGLPRTLIHVSGCEVLLHDPQLPAQRLASRRMPVEVGVWPVVLPLHTHPGESAHRVVTTHAVWVNAGTAACDRTTDSQRFDRRKGRH